MGKRKRKQNRRDTASAPSKPLTPEVKEAILGWAQEAADVHDLLLYEVDIPSTSWLIKVYIDHHAAEPGKGVSAAECGDVSRYIEAILDADERVPERYTLEVSSPGIERPLKTPRHVDLAVGHDVELVLREPIEGQNKIIGRLLAHEDGVLKLAGEEEEEIAVEWDRVSRAKLKFDFSGNE